MSGKALVFTLETLGPARWYQRGDTSHPTGNLSLAGERSVLSSLSWLCRTSTSNVTPSRCCCLPAPSGEPAPCWGRELHHQGSWSPSASQVPGQAPPGPIQAGWSHRRHPREEAHHSLVQFCRLGALWGLRVLQRGRGSWPSHHLLRLLLSGSPSLPPV